MCMHWDNVKSTRNSVLRLCIFRDTLSKPAVKQLLSFFFSSRLIMSDAPLIDAVTIYSLLAVLGLLIVAFLGSFVALPKQSSTVDRATFVWYAFDALTHFILEGSFVWHSILGRTVNSGQDMFAQLCKEEQLFLNAFKR